MQLPCVGIIEEPLVQRHKKVKVVYGKEKPTEITSKIMRMNVMNLMWNVNECQLLAQSKRVPRSDAVNVKKAKGYGGLYNPLFERDSSDEDNEPIVEIESPQGEDITIPKFSQHLKLNPIGKARYAETSSASSSPRSKERM